jgi:hypothetical protein
MDEGGFAKTFGQFDDAFGGEKKSGTCLVVFGCSAHSDH